MIMEWPLHVASNMVSFKCFTVRLILTTRLTLLKKSIYPFLKLGDFLLRLQNLFHSCTLDAKYHIYEKKGDLECFVSASLKSLLYRFGYYFLYIQVEEI